MREYVSATGTGPVINAKDGADAVILKTGSEHVTCTVAVGIRYQYDRPEIQLTDAVDQFFGREW